MLFYVMAFTVCNVVIVCWLLDIRISGCTEQNSYCNISRPDALSEWSNDSHIVSNS